MRDPGVARKALTPGYYLLPLRGEENTHCSSVGALQDNIEAMQACNRAMSDSKSEMQAYTGAMSDSTGAMQACMGAMQFTSEQCH
jgi:hypothetical protein